VGAADFHPPVLLRAGLHGYLQRHAVVEQHGRVEIRSPHFGPTDRIVLSGNYGLEDSAAVKLTKAAPAEAD
jgi:hypothetical protein